jgi:hypothetical protein
MEKQIIPVVTLDELIGEKQPASSPRKEDENT